MLKYVKIGSFRLIPYMPIANMNPPLGDVSTFIGIGTVLTWELIVEEMMERFMI